MYEEDIARMIASIPLQYTFIMSTVNLDNYPDPIILFDGVCNLCSAIVQFIIKRDKQNIFRFASLQSEFGQALSYKYNLNILQMKTFILYDKGKVYTKSTGALMVARRLHGPVKLLYPFMILPRFIRDFFYKIISNNRYRWFGKKEYCWIPDSNQAIKFL